MKKSDKKRIEKLLRLVQREMIKEHIKPTIIVLGPPQTYTAPSTNPLWPQNQKIWCGAAGYSPTGSTSASFEAIN